MKHDKYFQFPLCALSFGQTVAARLNAIIDYSVVEAGAKLFQKLTVEQQREFLHGKTISRTNPNGISPHDWRQCGACYGASVIGVTYHNKKSMLERHEQLRNYIAEFEARHGRDALVRIKMDWVFDARNGHGITYSEFAVLCGIFSAIGDKELAIITRDRIQRCALGYRTAAVMEAELSRRADKAKPLTERQLRDTIARLHRNKFFARCTVSRRITYYSNRLGNEAFRKKIVERRTYPDFFRASQAAQDQIVTDDIKRRRQAVAGQAAKTPSLTQ